MGINKRKISLCLLLLFGLLIVTPSSVNATLLRNLKIGDNGSDVRELQIILNQDPVTRISENGLGSPGKETDYFGSKTAKAVARFQEKYRNQILAPAGLSVGNGYVGALTRAKLYAISNAGVSIIPSVSTFPATPIPKVPQVENANAGRPTTTIRAMATTTLSLAPTLRINSVFPPLVRPGERITITGEGFAPTGNRIFIGTGAIEREFTNISSPDGKTLSFIYESAALVPTDEQLQALPTDSYNEIEKQVRSAGAVMEDITHPYRTLKNEAELSTLLSRYGKTLSDLEDVYYVSVQTPSSVAFNKTVTFRGVRKFAFGGSSFSDVVKKIVRPISEAVNIFPKKAQAQLAGGGLNVSMIMMCTCSGGHLALLIGYTSGLMWFPPGFIPIVGSTYGPAFWLGFYTPSAGTCLIESGPTCTSIMGNLPLMYGAG